MRAEDWQLDLATWRSLLTLTKQFGRNGDGGSRGAWPERVWGERGYTRFQGVLLEGRVENWGTACGRWGDQEMILRWKKLRLYDDRKHPVDGEILTQGNKEELLERMSEY